MAADTAYLEGGPCAGRTRKITAAESDTGTLACKGGLYQNANGKLRPNGDIIFKYAGAVQTAGGGSQSLNAPHALKGWKALRKSVNRGMPEALDYSQHLTSASLRSLRRARKVRI